MSTELAGKIKQQIEYYFSGLNLKRDKFMREKMAADPEGFMPIATLLTFNRLKQLTTDEAVVVAAIRDSDKLTFNEDFTKVKSNIDFQNPENAVSLRTVHLRGFPVASTLDDLLEGLKPYGNIRFIEMRRNMGNKTFKGTINVEFNSKAEAEEFMGKTIMFAGKEITDKQMLADREKEVEEMSKRFTYCANSIVQFKNVGKETSNEEFRELLKPYLNEYSYVMRKEGDNQAVVRFSTSEEAMKAVQELKDKAIAEKPLKLSVLSGKKANSAWSQIRALMLDENKQEPATSEKREHEEEKVEEDGKRAKME